jgi:hypothetical protein
MPEAAIITEINAAQKDLYELSYSEKRFSDIEDTFNASRDLLSQTREDLERYVEKIEEMQRDIRENIEKSNEQKKQLEEDILLLDTEIQNIRRRQEETKKYIKKILIDDHRIGLEESADFSMYGLLFGKNFGKQLSERDVLNTLKDSSTQLLERQKSIEEQLNKIGTSKSIKIEAKTRII